VAEHDGRADDALVALMPQTAPFGGQLLTPTKFIWLTM
jgi:hypothetical protein